MDKKAKQRELLIDLRSQLVGKMHVQPFTIYNDKTIEDLLEAQPKTIEDLSKVKGFPASGKRLKGFGEAVIAIFNSTDSIDSIDVSGNNEKLEVSTKLKRMSAF